MKTLMNSLKSTLEIIETKHVELDSGFPPPLDPEQSSKPNPRCEWELEPCAEQATMFYDQRYTARGDETDDVNDETSGSNPGITDKYRPGLRPHERIERVYLCPRHFVYRMRSLDEIASHLAYKGTSRLDEFVDKYGFLTDPHSATIPASEDEGETI